MDLDRHLDRHLPPASRRRVLRVLMGAGAGLILVWIIARLDAAQLATDLRTIAVVPFLAVIGGFTLTALGLDILTHYYIFSRFNPPARLGAVARTRGETYLLLSLGFLAGQGGMAVAYSRRAGRPVGEVTGSLFFLMFNTVVSMMVFPTLALGLMVVEGPAGFRGSPEWRFLVRWLLVSWPLVALHFMFWSKDWKHRLRQRAKTGLGRSFDQARARDYLVTLGLRGVMIGLWVGFSWLGLRAAGVEIPLYSLVVLGPIVGLASAIPTPGRLGTSQAAWVLLFGHLAPAEKLFAFSLIWTVATNLLRWAIGAVFIAVPDRDGPGRAD